ncbi:hypothetical protein ULMS_13150 [Patiriisocius marinistellae]|uniref:Uncharacterized protein n=1 Tax=Patiriisocius marinistellae TaxID=2494560 RepID=A0A5J4FTI5_9FLAO|nr:hypothetical protein [Patiriisocius marinistellae]GEQ85807.1 hypothetical protein ULMS_13150 [Patiriisocius marinistellae]
MKTFQKIGSFIVLSVLLSVSVSAGNLAFLESSIDAPVTEEHSVQSKATIGMYFLLRSEAEFLVNVPKPDSILFSFEDETSKTNGLLNRSRKLSLYKGGKSQYFNLIFLNNSFLKDIMYPFHSFW